MIAWSISDFRILVERAKAAGFRVELSKNSHWKFVPPDKKHGIFYASNTPNRPERFILNVRKDLMRRGVQI